MAVSANVLRVSTTLRLGERVLVRCDDGLLSTEYVLFDATDIVLRATDPVTVRETGYITTARDALARLGRAGVTPELAIEAARAIPSEVVDSYSRSGTPLPGSALAGPLGPCELFDGAVFHAGTQMYEGAWLDLRAMAAALPAPGAAALLQAMHLSAALDEVPRSTPVHLATANATRDRRPGERTHRRVVLDGAADLVESLRRLEPNPHRVEGDPQRVRLVRDALLARVRERATAGAGPDLRAHLTNLESALSSPDSKSSGPLSDPELRAIDQQLASGDAHGVQERLDAIERARGTSAAIRYLRARAALVGGDEPPSSVAQALTSIANEERSFHEAELVAARAWLAAGEDAYARHFARRLAEDTTARDSERLIALEILDATATTNRSQPPPPVAGKEGAAAPVNVILPAHRPPMIAPSVSLAATELVAKQDGLAKSNGSARVDGAADRAAEGAAHMEPPARANEAAAKTDAKFDHAVKEARAPADPNESGPRQIVAPERVVEEARRPDPSLAPPIAPTPIRPVARVAPPGASMPPFVTVPPPLPARVPGVSTRYEPELVESLPLPLGASEDVLAVGDWPTTILQARTAMTRLARSLARDYRLWYGTTLRCNVLAVDAMQRHLTQRYAGATLVDPKVVQELQRHGALLSEIFARGLGGEWVDIAPSEPGYWAMVVPPSTRCWPIGRVFRFISLGHRERDLVSYFLEIEARSKRV